MAEARPSKISSVGKSSDVLPDSYCTPCFEVDGVALEVEGFCQDCFDFLCSVCVAAHRKGKLTRKHKVLDKSQIPQVKLKVKPQSSNGENCIHHQKEIVCSYCVSCDQLCCKICLMVDHQDCKVDMLSTIAVNVKHSQELKDLNHKLDMLKKGYNDNQSKAETHVCDVEKFKTEAIDDMKKIQDQVARLRAETEKQAEKVRAEDIRRMEAISSTCEVLGEQIDTIKSNFKNCDGNEVVFIAMKRAESQVKSFEARLEKLNTDNTVHQYKPNKKLQDLLNGIEVLGQLSFSNAATSSGPMLDKPVHIGDINIQKAKIRCLVLLPNQQIFLIHFHGSVKLMDMKTAKVVDELHLPGHPIDIAKVKKREFAVTCFEEKKIHFFEVTSWSISKNRELSVNGECCGMVYNELDQTLIVTYVRPGRIEVMSVTGAVLRSIEKDENGAQLFTTPWYVALSRDKTMMYVSDENQSSVTLMTLCGKVKALYKDDSLKIPYGICVNKSGIVYVVGAHSNTVHKIVPGSDKLELLLSQKDGLTALPISITYCDVEDKIYVGQDANNILKIFKMK